jgi:hypothetical protein
MSHLRRVDIGFANSPATDAFSRLRVGLPDTLFESTAEYGRSIIVWNHFTSGAASASAHVNDQSAARLTCGTESNAYSVRQTKQYFHYQPGKSQYCVMTFVMGAAVAGVDRRCGYFDAENGIFLEQHGTTDVAIVRRTKTSGSVVDNRVVQGSWNLDRLNGSNNINPSGLTLDLSKGQILVIDLQWLGVGRVRVGLDIGGIVVYLHEFQASNVLSTVYMSTAALPMRYEISNTAVQGSNHTLDAICATVMSEGGFQLGLGYHFGASNGITSIGVTTRRAILSIRPKATFGPSNRVVRGHIQPHELQLLAGTNNGYYELIYNPTLTTGGGALTWTSADAESTVEYCVHGDANAGAFTGGNVIENGYVATGSGSVRSVLESDLSSRIPLTLDQAGANPTALSIVITSMSGTCNANAAINWEEYR